MPNLIGDLPGLIEINALIGRDAQRLVKLFRRNIVDLHLLQAEGPHLPTHDKAHPLRSDRVKGTESISFDAVTFEEIDPLAVFILLQGKSPHAPW